MTPPQIGECPHSNIL